MRQPVQVTDNINNPSWHFGNILEININKLFSRTVHKIAQPLPEAELNSKSLPLAAAGLNSESLPMVEKEMVSEFSPLTRVELNPESTHLAKTELDSKSSPLAEVELNLELSIDKCNIHSRDENPFVRGPSKLPIGATPVVKTDMKRARSADKSNECQRPLKKLGSNVDALSFEIENL